jgi:hypothetical protein
VVAPAAAGAAAADRKEGHHKEEGGLEGNVGQGGEHQGRVREGGAACPVLVVRCTAGRLLLLLGDNSRQQQQQQREEDLHDDRKA